MATQRSKDAKTKPSKKRSHGDAGSETDWQRLRTRSARAVRAGLADDPEARPTNAYFWRRAKLVFPQR
jgi:hypothetical protein